jgi:hypothetical protein
MWQFSEVYDLERKKEVNENIGAQNVFTEKFVPRVCKGF